MFIMLKRRKGATTVMIRSHRTVDMKEEQHGLIGSVFIYSIQSHTLQVDTVGLFSDRLCQVANGVRQVPLWIELCQELHI